MATTIFLVNPQTFGVTPFANDYSLLFDGVDEFAFIADNPSLSITNNLTISTWVKTTQSGTPYLVAKWSPNYQYYMSLSSGKLYCGVSSDGGLTNAKLYRTTSATVNDGNWHHVAFTFASGTLKLYIDGTEITAVDKIIDGTCNSIYDGTEGFVVGSLSTTVSNHFNGKLDELSVWDTTALSGADISTIYNSGTPNDLSALSLSGNLVSWWRMGDGDTFPTLTDNAGSNDLAMTNMESGDIQTDVP